jgi:type IV secretion system protein VirB10
MLNNQNESVKPQNNDGALPSLDGAGNEEILGVPESKVRSKTNAGKSFYLIAMLGGALFLVFGVLFFMKSRAERLASQELAQPVKTAPKLDQTKVRNTALANQSLERVKADIKKREESEAEIKEAKEAEAERNRNAALAAAGNAEQAGGNSGAVGNAGGVAGAPGAANGPYQGAGGQQGQPAPRALTLREQQMAGKVLAFSSESSAQGASAAMASSGPQATPRAARFASDDQDGEEMTAPRSIQSQSQNKGAMAEMLSPTVLEPRRAGRLGNLDFLLKKNMTIPCALRTGIDTTLPGFLTCVAISDVYSANGVTKLVERGATFFGEQKSSISSGQTRVFIVWNRIDNPSGIFAELDSPGTDEMGYAGVGGHVDDRFWKRFGGAIMLSFIEDAVQAAAQSGQQDGQVSINNTSGAGSQMAAEALKGTINIPPTITVLPGKILNVMVARDVSFESVYRLVK